MICYVFKSFAAERKNSTFIQSWKKIFRPKRGLYPFWSLDNHIYVVGQFRPKIDGICRIECMELTLECR